jgi:hypothetical protein
MLAVLRRRTPAAQRIGLWRSLVARLVRDEEAAGSNPVSPTDQMSQDIEDTRTHGNVGSGVRHFGVRGWSSRSGADGELAEEFSGDGADDADVQVLYEQEDVGVGAGVVASLVELRAQA